MTRHLILTADSGRASVYFLDTEQDPGSSKPPHLVEQAALVNPEQRLQQSKLFANSRPGLRQGVAGGARHGVDDHRDANQREETRRFAESVMELAHRLAGELEAEHVVVAAPPGMLGQLRGTSVSLERGTWTVDEVGKDLTKLTAHQLHERLASDDLLPPPRRLGFD